MQEWDIGLSRQAEKFLAQHHLPDTFTVGPLRKAIQKLQGAVVTVDLKSLSGKWEGCYRIRTGKIRIIFSMNVETRYILVEIIDTRGSAYK